MKIKAEKNYFNESLYGKFFPYQKTHEPLILIKTLTSYNKKELNNAVIQMQRIGYKVILSLHRKWFKWKFKCARVVPYYQRLIIDHGWVENPDWEERLKNAVPKTIKHTTPFGIYEESDNGLRWKDRFDKVNMNIDDIFYTDTDLEIMAKFKDKWNPNGWPVVNTTEILKRKSK